MTRKFVGSVGYVKEVVPGVNEASVKLATEKATVQYVESLDPLDGLRHAVADSGYSAEAMDDADEAEEEEGAITTRDLIVGPDCCGGMDGAVVREGSRVRLLYCGRLLPSGRVFDRNDDGDGGGGGGGGACMKSQVPHLALLRLLQLAIANMAGYCPDSGKRGLTLMFNHWGCDLLRPA